MTHAVALLAGVEPVPQRAVEVVVVRDDRGAELDEVEEHVPAHERVGRPLDRGHVVRERPAALELLQREPDRAAPVRRGDAGDVRVEVELGLAEPEEPERDADELAVAVGPGDEAAGVGERAQQACRGLRLAVVPDALDQLRARLELGERDERSDDHPGPLGGTLGGRRRVLSHLGRNLRAGERRPGHAPIVPRRFRGGMVDPHKLRGRPLAWTPNRPCGERRESVRR